MQLVHKGQKPWNTGKKRPEITGDKNWKWLGDEVGYHPLHQWVVRNLGKAIQCIKCGLLEIPENMKRYFQWANISGEYKRETEDWIQLCLKCHKEYDVARRVFQR